MSSPVLHYEFNQSTSLIHTDTSGTNNHLSGSGLTSVTDPLRGPVALFGSAHDVSVTPSSFTGKGAHTYMVWVKVPDVANRCIFSTPGHGIELGLTENGTVYYRVYGYDRFGNSSNYWSHFAATVQVNTWHHFAASFDGDTTTTFYLDGVSIKTRPYYVIGRTDATLTIYLGQGEGRSPEEFAGCYVSDFRVYDDSTVAVGLLDTISTPIVPLITLTSRSINIPVTIGEVDGATQYQITYEGPTGGEVVAVSDTTDLSYNITGVDPETEYTVKLYADTGAGYQLEEEVVTTTLPNVAENYDLTDFQDSDGVFDLTSVSDVSVISELLSAGDVVKISVSNESELTSTYVGVGENVSITNSGLLIPFENTGELVNVTLADGVTTIPVTFEEVGSTVTVNSNTYSTGDEFVLDGHLVGVLDYNGMTVLGIEELPATTVDPGPINIPVVIGEYPGATEYTITYEGPTGGEVSAVSNTTTLQHNIVGVEPETEYTVRVYADTGSGFEIIQEIATTTLSNLASNYDISDFEDSSGVVDLTSLDESSFSHVASVLFDLVNTGDVVNVVAAGESGDTVAASVVKQGESIAIADAEGILLPFSADSGAGQTAALTLSDDSSIPITYDEVGDVVSVDSTTGTTFVVDGKKLEIFEYQGLKVLSVNESPMLFVPKAVNIHVTIVEVPDSTAYKLSYVNPSGVEVTAVKDVTSLVHNVMGLVSDTEYEIKLYVDTGSGYNFKDSIPVKTLTNIAVNYDIADLKTDGIVNLSSLPDQTVENIADVMNELFDTGDVVEVSLKNKSSGTSFIQLGDVYPIQNLEGVLLPFIEESGTGQEVGVVLSDGETQVAIDYNETVNSITVADVVYYPGDTFILDGKKVSVVDYT